MKILRFEPIRVNVIDVNAYQPEGCTKATITGIFWDNTYNRVSVSLVYDNAKSDCIPLSEIREGYYEVANRKIVNN